MKKVFVIGGLVTLVYLVARYKVKAKGHSNSKLGATIFGVPYVENKSNVVSGGSTFDEVCYKDCANGCKLDDSGCFTKCRANCTSKSGGKATSKA